MVTYKYQQTSEAAMDDKIPFCTFDLRNISHRAKTRTKTRAQCLMVNTESLTFLFHLRCNFLQLFIPEVVKQVENYVHFCSTNLTIL